jgi:hypothetical protein
VRPVPQRPWWTLTGAAGRPGDSYRRALALSSGEADTTARLGSVLQRMGATAAAWEQYQRAVALLALAGGSDANTHIEVRARPAPRAPKLRPRAPRRAWSWGRAPLLMIYKRWAGRGRRARPLRQAGRRARAPHGRARRATRRAGARGARAGADGAEPARRGSRNAARRRTRAAGGAGRGAARGARVGRGGLRLHPGPAAQRLLGLCARRRRRAARSARARAGGAACAARALREPHARVGSRSLARAGRRARRRRRVQGRPRRRAAARRMGRHTRLAARRLAGPAPAPRPRARARRRRRRRAPPRRLPLRHGRAPRPAPPRPVAPRRRRAG